MNSRKGQMLLSLLTGTTIGLASTFVADARAARMFAAHTKRWTSDSSGTYVRSRATRQQNVNNASSTYNVHFVPFLQLPAGLNRCKFGQRCFVCLLHRAAGTNSPKLAKHHFNERMAAVKHTSVQAGGMDVNLSAIKRRFAVSWLSSPTHPSGEDAFAWTSAPITIRQKFPIVVTRAAALNSISREHPSSRKLIACLLCCARLSLSHSQMRTSSSHTVPLVWACPRLGCAPSSFCAASTFSLSSLSLCSDLSLRLISASASSRVFLLASSSLLITRPVLSARASRRRSPLRFAQRYCHK